MVLYSPCVKINSVLVSHAYCLYCWRDNSSARMWMSTKGNACMKIETEDDFIYQLNPQTINPYTF